MNIRSILAAVLLGGSLLGHSAAHAAIAETSVSVDWGSITARLDSDPISTFDLGQSSTSVGARAEYVDNAGAQLSSSSSGWGSLSVISSIPNAFGHGYSSPDDINAVGNGIADGVINTYGRGTAYAYRIGYFTVLSVTASYVLDFAVPFSVRHFFDYNPSTDGVGAYSRYAIGVYYVDPADGGTKAYPGDNGDSGVFSHYSGGPEDWNGTWTASGVLSVSDFMITGYTTYAIDAFVYTDGNAGTAAVVPEPGTLALLGLGLAGLAAARRRKQ